MHGTNPILMTVVAAVAAGVMIIACARRLGLPAIVLLLVGGVALGHEGLGIVQPELLGDGLRVMVSLLVGVILFEGGLTLDLRGYRQAPRIITRLLSVGVLCTWAGIALAIWGIGGQPLTFSIVCASLLIVTGPTVVGPLLKRINVHEKVHHVLQWEGVLIDPIGVFVAILCLELYAFDLGGAAFLGLGLRVGTGLVLGLVGGYVLQRALREAWLPRDMAGVGSLASAILLFGLSELIVPEAGLLTVTIAGFYVGYRRPAGLEAVVSFKKEITELAVGMLFVLLTARLDLAQFLDFGLVGVGIVAAAMFIVRPLSVLVSTAGLRVPWRERMLLGWIAPRGIVAASMASLLALELERQGMANARFVESLTYAVIVGTIIVQGGSAGWLARLLGLVREPARGWAIVGADRLGRGIARFLQDQGVEPVVLVDSNRRRVRQANAERLQAVAADARDVETLAQRIDLTAIGHVLALTDNEDLNTVVCRNWTEALRLEGAHRWQSMPTPERNRARNGAPVWSAVPSPGVVDDELADNDARLGSAASGDGNHHHLLTVHDGEVQLADGSELRGDVDGVALVLNRDLGDLGAGLRQAVSFELTATGRRAVVEQALQRLHALTPHLSVDSIREQIDAQEAELPSSFGEGVAVPHAHVEGLAGPLCALVKLTRPVDWDAPDDEPVDIVMLVLSPEGDHEGHLTLLADIARRLGDARLRQTLRDRDVADWPDLVLHAAPWRRGVTRAA